MIGKTVQKTVVLMPEKLSEFISALAVITKKMSVSDFEVVLIVQENLHLLCSLLCPFKVLSFQRDSKNDLETLLSSLKKEQYQILYNCSNSHIASWLSKRINATLKIDVSDFRSNGISGSETFENVDENKQDESNDHKQFLEMASVDLDPFNVSFTNIKRHLKRLIRPSANQIHHVTSIYARVLGVDDFNPELWSGRLIAKDPEYAGMIVLCPGGVRGAGRQWPYFNDLVRILPSEDFVILGTEHDIEIAKSIAPYLPHRVRNLAGKVSVDKAASIIAGASVVVANESGFLQLAGYIGAPSIGIFGSSLPEKYKPLGKNSTIVYNNEKCSPCDRPVCNKMDVECMSKVTADKIVEEIFAFRHGTHG